MFPLDPLWNPSVEAHAVDRRIAIGQPSGLRVPLIALDTVEEVSGTPAIEADAGSRRSHADTSHSESAREDLETVGCRKYDKTA